MAELIITAPELQILKDIKEAFQDEFSIELTTHHGDEIAVAEAVNKLRSPGTNDPLDPGVEFCYWLVPDENDKEETVAQSTEGEVQTFTADLLIFGRSPDAVIQELFRVFALIYKTSNLIAGIPDAPQQVGDAWFHRFDPRDNRITMRAVLNDGVWYCKQELIISASIDV